MKMDKQETKNIIKGLSQYGKRAYNNALKEEGYAIVLKGNNICRINADDYKKSINENHNFDFSD
jgi:hypothetical protein